MWKDEKAAYLRKNRDYSRLLGSDNAEVETARSQGRGKGTDRKFEEEDDDVRRERQDFLDRRNRLKELERQKLTKGKSGLHTNGIKGEGAKAGSQSRGHGESTSRGDVEAANGKEKKKLPYDRSFGSFFGPSEPIVAKRIIEESRTREEAQIAAARQAKANREPQRSKPVASSKPPPRPAPQSRPAQKPPDKVNAKAGVLKQARDYSFLFNDSPLPEAKVTDKGSQAPANAGRGANDDRRASDQAKMIRSVKKPPLDLSKGSSAARSSNGSGSSARLPPSRSGSGQLARQGSGQASRGQISSDRLASKSSVQRASLAGPSPSKASSARPNQTRSDARSDPRSAPRKGSNSADLDALKKIVSGTPASIGKKSNVPSSASLDRRNLPTIDCYSIRLEGERPPPPQGKNKALAQSVDRRNSQSTDRRAGQGTERRPVQVDRSERRPMAAQQASQRLLAASKDSRMGASARAPNGHSAADRLESRRLQSSQTERQVLQAKTVSKAPSRPPVNTAPKRMSSANSRGRDPYDRRVDHRGIASPSEDDDDSFIDDDDAGGANVSSLIQRIMGYNPDKYRGNDDYDDRAMEVGFRTIQAEERRSAREARKEDEREQALIEAEEKAERLRKAKKRKQSDR